MTTKITFSHKPLILALCITLTGCAEFDSYNSRPYDYDRPSYDSYGRDRYYDNQADRARRERWELERERDRAREERERLERERNRPSYSPPSYSPPRPQPEHCPSGFSPSENKCSSEERRRGCQDIRLPGGLGCVRR